MQVCLVVFDVSNGEVFDLTIILLSPSYSSFVVILNQLSVLKLVVALVSCSDTSPNISYATTFCL